MAPLSPISFSPEEVSFFSDEAFFPAKARITVKVRQTWEQLHHILKSELNGKPLIAPEGFNAEAVQFVKGEHLEDFPYQYLDYPRHYTRENKLAFRSLFWWGHHVIFALIVEGAAIRLYKQNLINRYGAIADQQIDLCLSPSLWEWNHGPGYTLELTRERRSEVAAVLANRPFFKLARYISLQDPLLQSGALVKTGLETFQTLLPIITS